MYQPLLHYLFLILGNSFLDFIEITSRYLGSSGYYKKVRDYYRNIVEEEIDSARFINQARIVQEEMKKNKTANLDPLKVKQIWKDAKI